VKILLLLVIVAAVVAFLVMRPKQSTPHKALNRPRGSARSGKTPGASIHPYSATTISFDDKACDAVKALGDRVFLDAERNTPLLPVQGCDAPRCDCRYVHREDRREVSEDRRHPSGLQAELYDAGVNKNRREKKHGRRRDDLS
jgi:hypothetical protein